MMPNRHFALVLVVAILYVVLFGMACRGSAQDVDVTLPEVGETLALEHNERAPWAGMLVRDEDLFALQSLVMSTQLELRNARSMYDEAIAGRATLLEAARSACDERVELHDVLWRERRDELAEAVRDARERQGAQWYEIAGYGLVGAAIGALIGLGVGFALGG